MKRIVLALSLTIVTAGPAAMRPPVAAHAAAPVRVEPTDAPFVLVTAGPVSGLVPEHWAARPIDTGPRGGFLASPRISQWDGHGLPSTGIAVTWVDATVVGVATDYYYLAASGPVVSRLVDGRGCRTLRREVFADHVPGYLDGGGTSPGDFIARGEGICERSDGRATRWSYFVAAPGYGPATELGIPGSGLYLVTAVTAATRGAHGRLTRLLGQVRFGDTRLGDFVRAVRLPAAL